MNSSRVASFGVVLGGLFVVVGSLLTWGSCPDSTCGFGGLQAFFDKSGIDSGAGVVTAILGVPIVLIGFDALRNGGISRWRTHGIWLAIAAFLVVAAHVVRVYVFRDNGIWGPRLGVYVVAVGAALAAVAGVRLSRVDRLNE